MKEGNAKCSLQDSNVRSVLKYGALFVRLVVSGRYTFTPRHFGLAQTPFAPERSLVLTGSAGWRGMGRRILALDQESRLLPCPDPQNIPSCEFSPAGSRDGIGRTEQITLFICQTVGWLTSYLCHCRIPWLGWRCMIHDARYRGRYSIPYLPSKAISHILQVPIVSKPAVSFQPIFFSLSSSSCNSICWIFYSTL